MKLKLVQDSNDKQFFHCYMEEKTSKLFICSFHEDNLWDIFGKEDLEYLKNFRMVEIKMEMVK